MRPGELPRGPALLVEVGGADQLLEHAELVVGVEDGEVGLEADQLGVAAQHSRADAVEGAEPGHAFDRTAGDRGDALLHFARGLVGEGDGEDLAGPGFAGRDQMGEAGGEGRGLARARAGEDQHRPFGRQHGLALRRIEAGELGGFGGRAAGLSGTAHEVGKGRTERQPTCWPNWLRLWHEASGRTKGDQRCRRVNAIAERCATKCRPRPSTRRSAIARTAGGTRARQWSPGDWWSKDELKVEGETKEYASSEHGRRHFCPECGTALFYTSDVIFPGQIDVQIATLDDPDRSCPMRRSSWPSESAGSRSSRPCRSSTAIRVIRRQGDTDSELRESRSGQL